ncbi:MAG TPA: hypothetical protein VHP36_05645 [Chitinispirillaceae bacterium]|nr:hypothetical protein [Chitinispirillaceae bacterium]
MKWLVLLTVLLIQCGYEFPTGYETIDNDKVRPVVMIFNNHQLAEGSPLDTIDLRAYFGGEKINSIRWSILSRSRFDAEYNDTIPIEQIMLTESYKEYFGTGTDSASMLIMVPDSLIRHELGGLQNVGALIPSFMKSYFSADFLKKSSDDVLDMLDYLSNQPSSGLLVADSLVRTLSGDAKIDIKEFMPRILQIFSVPLNIYVVVNEKFKAKSAVTIRYNNRLRYLGSYIPVNRNPQIQYIRLYRINGDRATFDPRVDPYVDYYDLTGFDSIAFNKKYSYFLEVTRKAGLVDTSISLQGLRDEEHFTCEWLLQDINNQGTDSDFLRIVRNLSAVSVVKIKIPSNPVGRVFTVWSIVYDYSLGERLRPVGFATRCASAIIVNQP